MYIKKKKKIRENNKHNLKYVIREQSTYIHTVCIHKNNFMYVPVIAGQMYTYHIWIKTAKKHDDS
jgi:hypothetical protein